MSGGLYGEGAKIVARLQDLDGPNVNPACQTRLYTHGRRTERALVLFHGFTSCPHTKVSTHEFPLTGRLPHDLIDPSHPSQKTAVVYPVVSRFIEGG